MKQEILSIAISEIPFGSKLVIYGDGKVGELTIGRLRYLPGIEIVAVSDKYLQGYSFAAKQEIINPILLVNLDFDYIILAAESENVRIQMREDLINLNIQSEKMRSIDWEGNESIVRASYMLLKERNATSRRVFWLFMVPEHGNVGDYAIAVSTEKILMEAFPQDEIVAVTANAWDMESSNIRKLVQHQDVLFFNGGGYVGDLWDNTERYRSIINAFPDNTIIMLPNTLTYKEEPTDENISFVQDAKWFQKHSKLHVLFRDKKSFDNIIKYGQNYGYFPDMALGLSVENLNTVNDKKVLLCLRNDREKTFDAKPVIIDDLSRNEYIYDEFEINFKKYVSYNDADELIKYVCNKFQDYQCIITDRLHGMVLATICNVPCVAFDNSSHKVRGVYDWIKEYVIYCDVFSTNSIAELIERAVKKKNIAGDYAPPRAEFTKLIKYIKNVITIE